MHTVQVCVCKCACQHRIRRECRQRLNNWYTPSSVVRSKHVRSQMLLYQVSTSNIQYWHAMMLLLISLFWKYYQQDLNSGDDDRVQMFLYKDRDLVWYFTDIHLKEVNVVTQKVVNHTAFEHDVLPWLRDERCVRVHRLDTEISCSFLGCSWWYCWFSSTMLKTLWENTLSKSFPFLKETTPTIEVIFGTQLV